MSLISVREQFVRISGRYDLVIDATDWANNGADFYIQSGQRWLDRRADIYKGHGRHYRQIVAGEWYALLEQCRVIREVWVSDSDREKWQLQKYDLRTIREDYNEDPTLIDNGGPLYYAPVTVRVVPESGGQMTIDQFGAVTYTAIGDHYGYDGLVWMPPADGTYTLEVWGTFDQPALVNDNDRNYWTEQEGFILVLAALRALEVTYRNTAGVKDWESAIDSELLGREFDYVDEISSGIPQMEG